jgi:hypothetical protein
MPSVVIRIELATRPFGLDDKLDTVVSQPRPSDWDDRTDDLVCNGSWLNFRPGECLPQTTRAPDGWVERIDDFGTGDQS